MSTGRPSTGDSCAEMREGERDRRGGGCGSRERCGEEGGKRRVRKRLFNLSEPLRGRRACEQAEKAEGEGSDGAWRSGGEGKSKSRLFA